MAKVEAGSRSCEDGFGEADALQAQTVGDPFFGSCIIVIVRVTAGFHIIHKVH